MMNRVKLYQAERLDLTDALNIQGFVENELQEWTSSIFAGTLNSYILKGFEPTVVANLNITVAVANSVLFNSAVTSGDMAGSTFRAPSTSPGLSLTLTDNVTNYVHLVVNRISKEADLRVFWDRIANAGEGAEWSQIVNTIDTLDVSLYVSTVGWSVDDDKIPIFYATTAAGVITSLVDYRNLFFRLGKPGNPGFYNTLLDRVEPNPDKIAQPTAFTAADKEITNFKAWMDVVMSALKEIKWGTTTSRYWYEQAPGSLTQGNDVLTAGGNWSWTLSAGPGSVGDLAFSSDAIVIMYGSAFTNSIDFTVSSPIVLNDGDVAFVDLVRTASSVLTVTVVASGSYTSNPDRLIIAKRTGDVAFVGNTPLILNPTDTGTLSIAITSAFASYVGAPSFSPPAPDYNASGIAPSTVLYVTNGADDLTKAIAKHDVKMQEIALQQLPPIGTIIPFYDYNGALAFDSNYWAYCDGSVKTISGIGAQTLPDLSNRYLVGFGTESGGDIGTAAWATGTVGNASHQINIAHSHTVNAHTHSVNISHGHLNTISASVPAHYHGKGSISIGVASGAHTHSLRMVAGNDGYPNPQPKWDNKTNYDQTSTISVISTGSSHTHPNSSFSGAVGNTSGVSGDSALSCSMSGSITAASASITSGTASSSDMDSQLSSAQSVQPRSIRVRYLMRIK